MRVLEVRGDVVRVGIDAPRDVQVHRQEVYEAVREANIAASTASEEAITALQGIVRRAGAVGPHPVTRRASMTSSTPPLGRPERFT